jgi:hypothetical protein
MPSSLLRLVIPVDPVRSVCGHSPREPGALEWRLSWPSGTRPQPRRTTSRYGGVALADPRGVVLW